MLRSIPSIWSSIRQVTSSLSLPAARSSPPTALNPNSADAEAKLTLLPLEPAAERPGLTPALPVDYWFNGDFAETLSATQPYTYTSLQQMFEKGLGTRTTFQFVSPDGSLFIPTNAPIVQGEPYFGTKWVPVLEAYGLVKGTEGKPFYATNEAEQRTYRGLLNADGSLIADHHRSWSREEKAWPRTPTATSI